MCGSRFDRQASHGSIEHIEQPTLSMSQHLSSTTRTSSSSSSSSSSPRQSSTHDECASDASADMPEPVRLKRFGQQQTAGINCRWTRIFATRHASVRARNERRRPRYETAEAGAADAALHLFLNKARASANSGRIQPLLLASGQLASPDNRLLSALPTRTDSTPSSSLDDTSYWPHDPHDEKAATRIPWLRQHSSPPTRSTDSPDTVKEPKPTSQRLHEANRLLTLAKRRGDDDARLNDSHQHDSGSITKLAVAAGQCVDTLLRDSSTQPEPPLTSPMPSVDISIPSPRTTLPPPAASPTIVRRTALPAGVDAACQVDDRTLAIGFVRLASCHKRQRAQDVLARQQRAAAALRAIAALEEPVQDSYDTALLEFDTAADDPEPRRFLHVSDLHLEPPPDFVPPTNEDLRPNDEHNEFVAVVEPSTTTASRLKELDALALDLEARIEESERVMVNFRRQVLTDIDQNDDRGVAVVSPPTPLDPMPSHIPLTTSAEAHAADHIQEAWKLYDAIVNLGCAAPKSKSHKPNDTGDSSNGKPRPSLSHRPAWRDPKGTALW